MAIDARPTTADVICRALGIDPHDVIALDLQLRPGELPRVLVTRVLDYDDGANELAQKLTSYDLVERTRAPIVNKEHAK